MKGINTNTAFNALRHTAASVGTVAPKLERAKSAIEEFTKNFDNGLKKLGEKFSRNSEGGSTPAQTQREEMAKQRAAAQTSQLVAENNGLSAPENAFQNLTPWNTLTTRHEHANSVHSPIGFNGKQKSFVTHQGSLRPAGPITMNLLAGTPSERETAMASAIFKHVMEHDKDSSPLTSATDGGSAAAGTLHGKFGSTILSIDPGKSQSIQPELAVKLLLGAHPEGGDQQKTWNWRDDKHLQLNAGEAKQLAAAMELHGIDPHSDKFTAAEKAATFVLATHESFIVGPTEDNAVKVKGTLSVAD